MDDLSGKRYRVCVVVPTEQIFAESWSAEQVRDYIVQKADEYASNNGGVVVEHCRREFSQQVQNGLTQSVEMTVDYIQQQIIEKPDIITQ